MQFGKPYQGQIGTLQHHVRRVIAAHHIKRDGKVLHQGAWIFVFRLPARGRLPAHGNARTSRKRDAGASAHRNWGTRRTTRSARHHGRGACYGATWRFSSWERPSERTRKIRPWKEPGFLNKNARHRNLPCYASRYFFNRASFSKGFGRISGVSENSLDSISERSGISAP